MQMIKQIVRATLDALLDVQEHKLRPSNLGHCERRNALSILHQVPDEDVERSSNWGQMGKGAMVMGKIIEAALAPYFKKRGFLYQCLVKIVDDLEGHIDFYLPQGENSDYAVVLDLKTTGKSSIPYLPNPAHILQVSLYMYGVMEGEVWEVDDDGKPIRKLETPSDVRGVIYYLVREDPYYMFEGQEHWIAYNPAIAEKGIKAFFKLREKVAAGEIPPIPTNYKPFSFPCYYSNQFGEAICPFWDMCWKEKMESASEEMKELAIDLIKAYSKRKEFDAEYERLRDLFLDLTKDKMQEQVVTPIGFIKKFTVTRTDVNWQGVCDTLVNEGYIDREVLEEIMSQHTVRKTYSKVDVKTRRVDDRLEDEI